MKKKSNKKHYNFTAKQKRKDSFRIYPSYGIGKEWKIMKSREIRRGNQRILYRIIVTSEEEPFVLFKKTKAWEL